MLKRSETLRKKTRKKAVTETDRTLGKTKVQFPYAIRSFMGYLEGTHKSAHTIKNYQLDIQAFQTFLMNEYGRGSSRKPVSLDQITPMDLERFRLYLKEQGLRTNTRRRKILTVTQFLNYLAKRKKVAPEMGHRVPAPHKVERIPLTVSARRLVEEIRQLSRETLLDARNQCLLWTLAETGCLVSEVAELRYEQWAGPSAGAAFGHLHLGGKFERKVPVPVELYQAVMDLKLRSVSEPSSRIFLGFNKFGPLGTSAITSRGVELLVKHYGPKLGFPELTPRTFRHSVILQWFQDGIAQNVIQTRLGLKTTYAFRSYAPLLGSGSKGGASVSPDVT